MKKIFTLLSLSLFTFTVNSQILGTYDFTGTGACPNQNPNVISQPTGGTFSSFTSNGIDCVVTNNVYNSDNWPVGPIEDTSYLEFTLTADIGMVLNLDSLIFASRISSDSSVWHLKSSVNSFGNDIASGTSFNTLDTIRILLGSNFASLGAITFRFFNSEVTDNQRAWRVDDVMLKGTITTGGIVDTDGDGFTGPDDCDETNPSIHVGATEIPNNGIDEDCVGGDLIVGIFELNSSFASVYPNPGTSDLTIRTLSENKDLNVKIFTTSGKLVSERNFVNSNEVSINTSILNSGLYFIEISTENNSSKLTWIKK